MNMIEANMIEASEYDRGGMFAEGPVCFFEPSTRA